MIWTRKNIRDLEYTVDSCHIHPDNWSKDPQVIDQIRGKRSQIMNKLWDIGTKIDGHDDEIQSSKE